MLNKNSSRLIECIICGWVGLYKDTKRNTTEKENIKDDLRNCPKCGEIESFKLIY